MLHTTAVPCYTVGAHVPTVLPGCLSHNRHHSNSPACLLAVLHIVHMPPAAIVGSPLMLCNKSTSIRLEVIKVDLSQIPVAHSQPLTLSVFIVSILQAMKTGQYGRRQVRGVHSERPTMLVSLPVHNCTWWFQLLSIPIPPALPYPHSGAVWGWFTVTGEWWTNILPEGETSS